MNSEQIIEITNQIDTLKTGDLLLCDNLEQKGLGLFGWLIKYGSQSDFSHIAMVVVNPDFTYLDKRYDSLYLRYGEGYYGVTGESLNNIITITFQTCATSRMNGSDPVARLFTRNVKNSNGLWNRNWGIYNTI